jgi:Tfp pilus assembly protein PilF
MMKGIFVVLLLFALTGAVFAQEDEERDTRLEQLSEAIRRNPNDAEAYLTRGIFYNDIWEPDEAIVDFNKAISINPNCAEA